MSDIDLKALRGRCENAINNEKAGAWNTDVPLRPRQIIALLDRLEAAEKYQAETREMATKHGQVLQRIGTALGLPAGADLHVAAVPAAHALVARAEAVEKEQLEQARLLGMGAERELALMGKLREAEKERDSYRGMFNAAVADLAEISAAAGVPEEDAACANGNEEILEAIAELRKDAKRLDFLDGMNAALNRRYGTTYRWKLVLSPNIVRLMSGAQRNGYVGDIDLHDSDARGLESCRQAIDAAMAQEGGK